MPTEEQLDILFESELEFKFKNVLKPQEKKTQGKVIGTLKYNPKTKRVEFTPSISKKKS